IYTSGSTGNPKGVMVPHTQLVQSIAARFDHYKQVPTKFLLVPSYSFDSSVAVIFWTLCSGGALIITREGQQRDIKAMADLIKKHGVTHLLCLPSIYGMLLREARGQELETLTTIIVAGEACPAELAQRHEGEAESRRLYNEYGP